MARGRNNSAISRPNYVSQPGPTVVSSGTVSKPKPFRIGKLRNKQPNTRIVQAPGASGTI